MAASTTFCKNSKLLNLTVSASGLHVHGVSSLHLTTGCGRSAGHRSVRQGLGAFQHLGLAVDHLSCSQVCKLSSRRRVCRVSTRAAVQAYPTEVQQQFNTLLALKQWTEDQFNCSTCVEPKVLRSEGDGFRVTLVASQDVEYGQAVLQLPDKAAITSTDAVEHPLVGAAAESCGGFQLAAMALWLMAERAAGQQSFWHVFLQALPETTDSPILWEESERAELLQGTSIQSEASQQVQALEAEWQRLHDTFMAQDPQRFPPEVFNKDAFLRAFCVVAAHAFFLPSAECWALVPLVAQLGKKVGQGGTGLDYNLATSKVELSALETYRPGREVLSLEERPSGDLLLACGQVFPNNPNDFLPFNASLVAADRYWQGKAAILEQVGMGPKQVFPVYKDRMPLQLFAYLRLSRIQEPLLFAKVSFEQDVKLSDMNEYEVLQLLLGDCRDKMFAFKGNSEEDVKLLQDPNLSRKARLAAQLCLSEKEIVASAMDAVRRKLAPIRGIPTKGGGMQDPNQDILEVFEFIETLPQQPGKFFRNVFGLDEKKPR